MDNQTQKMMTDQDLTQGSSRWHDWRKQKIGSSEIACVIGENPYKTAYQLWEEKTGATEPPDLSGNYFVKRGQELEPYARSLYNDTTEKNFHPASFNHENYSWAGYSSDGFDAELNEIIEIKCMNEKKHLEFIETNTPPAYYKAQVHYGLWISGAKCAHFISYNPSSPTPIHSVTIYPDKDYIENIISEGIKFWHLVQTNQPPELTESDFKTIESTATQELAEKWRKAKLNANLADVELQNVTNEIKKLSDGKRIKFFGIKVNAFKRKGNIDYEKIPELAGIDLEQYRKKETISYRIDGDL